MSYLRQIIGVSPSPSKIPYSGFSPVRLQTEIQPPPSTYPPTLSVARIRSASRFYKRLESRHPVRATHSRVYRSRSRTDQAVLSPVTQDDSVQRPLAHQWVMLSRRVIAYYGLIRASRVLPSTYLFVDGSSYPWDLSGRDARGSPIYSLFLYLRAALRTPVNRMAASGCASPFALAFVASIRTRHPQSSRIIGSGVGSVTRLQGSFYTAARRLARSSPTRAFTLELSPAGSLQTSVEYDYTGKQPIPATGLSPARNKALWAANREHRENHRMKKRVKTEDKKTRAFTRALSSLD